MTCYRIVLVSLQFTMLGSDDGMRGGEKTYLCSTVESGAEDVVVL